MPLNRYLLILAAALLLGGLTVWIGARFVLPSDTGAPSPFFAFPIALALALRLYLTRKPKAPE